MNVHIKKGAYSSLIRNPTCRILLRAVHEIGEVLEDEKVERHLVVVVDAAEHEADAEMAVIDGVAAHHHRERLDTGELGVDARKIDDHLYNAGEFEAPAASEEKPAPADIDDRSEQVDIAVVSRVGFDQRVDDMDGKLDVDAVEFAFEVSGSESRLDPRIEACFEPRPHRVLDRMAPAFSEAAFVEAADLSFYFSGKLFVFDCDVHAITRSEVYRMIGLCLKKSKYFICLPR